jgi:SAM-dependent methyltransferase
MSSHDATARYWSEPDRVEEFAQRDPDLRLVALMERARTLQVTRVLDLGCAAGRNTVPLASKGFDVWALDLARGMVARTRARLAALIGEDEASRRVVEGRMDDLGRFADGFFDLVVALGVYHMAKDEAELRRALAETGRVLRPGGLVLSAMFAPGVAFENRRLERVPGAANVFRDGEGDTVCLLDPPAFDAEMAAHGFEPVEPTVEVRRLHKTAVRVVTNGLHRKAES